MATQDRRVQHSRMKMTDTPSKKTEDYKDTVFLPVTAFPMKAGLAQKEPAMAERWAKIGIYDRLRKQRKGRARFILHEGTPYANGDIHMGKDRKRTRLNSSQSCAARMPSPD